MRIYLFTFDICHDEIHWTEHWVLVEARNTFTYDARLDTSILNVYCIDSDNEYLKGKEFAGNIRHNVGKYYGYPKTLHSLRGYDWFAQDRVARYKYLKLKGYIK